MENIFDDYETPDESLTVYFIQDEPLWQLRSRGQKPHTEVEWLSDTLLRVTCPYSSSRFEQGKEWLVQFVGACTLPTKENFALEIYPSEKFGALGAGADLWERTKMVQAGHCLFGRKKTCN